MNTILYSIFESPLGKCIIATTENGICALGLGDDDQQLINGVQTDYPHHTLSKITDTTHHQAYSESVLKYLAGNTSTIEIPLDIHGSSFQQKVWATLQSIPYGETYSYNQVATLLGNAKASRAVARACATNKIALIIPCHRVVRGNGDLSGFKWNIERKKKLLELESKYKLLPTEDRQS